MNEKPMFSIMVPVYNVEKFLSTCISSVLQQTYTNWELILVDDGSTDNSGKIADEFAEKYPGKIYVYHRSNHGVFATRRYAYTKARGNYYVYMDSDDSLATPKALEILHNKFTEYLCDCIIYEVKRISGEKVYSLGKIDKEELLSNRRAIYRKVLLDVNFNVLTRKAVKATCAGNWDFSSLYHISHGEDLLQSLEILHNCQSVLLLPDELYSYNFNPDSITQSAHAKPLRASFEVRTQVLEFLKRENIFTTQDMQDYHRYCIAVFEGLLRELCLHPASKREKSVLFNKLKKDDYFVYFLHSKDYKQPISWIYTLFCLGWYGVLIQCVRLRIFLSKLKHKFYDK